MSGSSAGAPVRLFRAAVGATAIGGIVALMVWTGWTVGPFVYFTVQSNSMLAVVFLASALVPARVPPVLRGATTLYLLITGLVYHLILVNPASPFATSHAGQGRLHDVLLHSVVPFLAAVDWCLFTAREAPRWWYAATWLAYPLAYLLFALVWGGTGHRYPYPFVDVDQLGYGGVAASAAVLTVLFFLLGLALVGLGRAAALAATVVTARRGSARSGSARSGSAGLEREPVEVGELLVLRTGEREIHGVGAADRADAEPVDGEVQPVAVTVVRDGEARDRGVRSAVQP